MAPEEKAEAGGSLSASSSGGGGKLTVVLTTANLAATLGLGAIVTLSHLKERNRPAVEDIAAHPEAESAAGEGSKDGRGAEGQEGAKDGKGRGAGKDAKKGHEYGKMVTLEQFTVNLATPGSVSPKFVRVNVSLEVQNNDVESEVNSKMPQVRNAIIDLFNSKRPTDLATSEGREYLKEEIRNAINGFIVTGKVNGVYFTNFAVSS